MSTLLSLGNMVFFVNVNTYWKNRASVRLIKHQRWQFYSTRSAFLQLTSLQWCTSKNNLKIPNIKEMLKSRNRWKSIAEKCIRMLLFCMSDVSFLLYLAIQFESVWFVFGFLRNFSSSINFTCLIDKTIG